MARTGSWELLSSTTNMHEAHREEPSWEKSRKGQSRRSKCQPLRKGSTLSSVKCASPDLSLISRVSCNHKEGLLRASAFACMWASVAQVHTHVFLMIWSYLLTWQAWILLQTNHWLPWWKRARRHRLALRLPCLGWVPIQTCSSHVILWRLLTSLLNFSTF